MCVRRREARMTPSFGLRNWKDKRKLLFTKIKCGRPRKRQRK